MPAITACLSVSVLVISSAIRIASRCGPNASCMLSHVSEPRSRTTNGSRSSRRMSMRDWPASGCDGAATIT
jgi:hypothetical protein